MISKEISDDLSGNFRVYYGKLYASLLKQFGAKHIDDIEDVIQNTLLKAMRLWKPDKSPKKKENWLFIVARNEMLNLLKAQRTGQLDTASVPIHQSQASNEDLRLNTIILLALQSEVTQKARATLVLKSIFGLHVTEISGATLLSEEAIHKSVNRTKKKLQQHLLTSSFDEVNLLVKKEHVYLVEEMLYAVFIIGFDSFDHKKNSIVNDDLCLEALSLTKLLWSTFKKPSTQNLLALFCFHLSRLPARVKDGKLIPFFEQDRSQWESNLLNLGYHYLTKPDQLDPYYLEGLITSKHMSVTDYEVEHWKGIVKLYKMWSAISISPLIRLNLAYALYLAGESAEPADLIKSLEGELPPNHMYFALIKAEMIKQDSVHTYRSIVAKVIDGLDQEVRKEYLINTLKPKLSDS